MTNKAGIYIHIPFCESRCYYCDFVSFVQDKDTQVQYINALLQQIDSTTTDNYIASSIYIGGGTPSFLYSGAIEQILNKLYNKFKLSENIEITIECNPNSLNEVKLQEYMSWGVNRLSLGMQSSDNDILKLIGRAHTYEDFLKSYFLARRYGFENINIDIMHGLPSQINEVLSDTLIKINKLEPEHVSCYGLMLEQDSALYQNILQGQIPMPDEDYADEQYYFANRQLQAMGFERYEVSNFAKDNKYSMHNLNYWKCGEYFGFGCGAHGYIDSRRYMNTDDLYEFINNPIGDALIYNQKQLSVYEKIQDIIMLGLRMVEGFELEKLYQISDKAQLEPFLVNMKRLEEKGYLERINNNIRFTSAGFEIMNKLLIQLIF